jgi:hypothetical protein
MAFTFFLAFSERCNDFGNDYNFSAVSIGWWEKGGVTHTMYKIGVEVEGVVRG